MAQDRCPVYKKCGGCQMDIPYPAQLSYKQRITRELLGRFGRVSPIVGADEPEHYRCKVSAAFGFFRGRVISGIWQSSGEKLAAIDSCMLEDERASRVVLTIRKLLPKFRLRTYDSRTDEGFLRFVTVRIGKNTGEMLVALGTGDGQFPSKKDFIAALVAECPEITTVVRCVSTGRLNLVLGEKEEVLHGPGFIRDRICGKTFRISARSFFQINPLQAEKLYSAAVEMAGLTGSETVIDAYCGVGSIGMIASGGAKSVLAAEIVDQAVKNAEENIRENGIENMRVFRADAGEFMAELAAEGAEIDVVFTDPPRAGCSKKFLGSLVSLKPKKIVYISCSPETQARDLGYLTKHGYRVDAIRPFDMFPYTRHIECITSLRLDPRPEMSKN